MAAGLAACASELARGEHALTTELAALESAARNEGDGARASTSSSAERAVRDELARVTAALASVASWQ